MDAVEPQVRVLLAEFPDMPTTAIMERVGWTRGKTVFSDRVQQLRPLFRRPDPAQRTDYLPGELAQCDLWFPPADVSLGFGQVGRPPVLVMVSGYSRWLSAVMIPSRQSPDLLVGHWRLPGHGGQPPGQASSTNSAASTTLAAATAPVRDRSAAGLRTVPPTRIISSQSLASRWRVEKVVQGAAEHVRGRALVDQRAAGELLRRHVPADPPVGPIRAGGR